eukprot:4363172-Amphidinium_carterae.2
MQFPNHGIICVRCCRLCLSFQLLISRAALLSVIRLIDLRSDRHSHEAYCRSKHADEPEAVWVKQDKFVQQEDAFVDTPMNTSSSSNMVPAGKAKAKAKKKALPQAQQFKDSNPTNLVPRHACRYSRSWSKTVITNLINAGGALKKLKAEPNMNMESTEEAAE